MGTSLSGLTPATTFDGLLKVGDNDPLTADLKAISTGDGTDTILQLSTTALQIGGDTTIETTGTWVDGFNSNLRLEANSPSMQFKDTSGTSGFMIGVTGGSTIFYQSSSADFSSVNAIGRIFGGRWSFGASTDLGASVGIKGSGADDTTTSLLVQNSAGTELLKVQDDGIIDSQYLRINGSSFSPTISAEGNVGKALRLGNEGFFSSFNYLDLKTWDGAAYSPAMRITGNTSQFVGIGETTPTARLHIKGGGNDNTTTALLVQNSDGADMMVLDDSKEVSFRGRSGFYNGVFIVENNHTKTQGNAIIGAFATPTARLHVKGGGNDDTTTSLLVQNSDGNDLLEVDDIGNVGIGGPNPLSATLHISSQSYFNNTTALRIQNSIGNNLLRVRGDGTTDILNSKYIFNQSGVSTGGAIFKGSGNDATTTALLVQNSDGATGFQVDDGGNIGLGNAPLTGIKVAQTSGAARFRDLYFGNIGSSAINNSSLTSINWNGSTGIGIANSEALAATAMLHIKGSAPVEDPPGTFTNPTALLVQNSAGANLLQVTDDGNLYGKTLNVSGLLKMNSGQTIRFGGSEAMSGNISTGNLDLGIHSNFTNTRVFSQLSVKGTGNGATTTALLVQNSDGTDMLRIMDGGADKVLRTSSAQIGSLEIVGANIGRGGGNPITFAGTNQIGMGEGTPTAKLHIKGTGNTPTTTALLVQNSDGTAAFKIQDDRKAVFSGLTEFSNNVQFLGANDTSSLNNMRFVVPGATKSFVINADYNLTNEPSALLEVQSTTKGFLPPRMTEGERNAIATPAVGLIVYQTDGEEGVYVNTTGGWRQMQLI